MQNMPFYKPKGRLLFFNTEYTLHYTELCRRAILRCDDEDCIRRKD